MQIKLQPARMPTGVLPYPYYVQADGTLGRQDFWKGNPGSLIGFQSRFDHQVLDFDLDDFLENPEIAINKYPVFQCLIEGKSKWVTELIAIESVEVME